MHPLLKIDEIQRLIFKHLSPRELSRLARTCKAFFRTATDERWRTIYSLSSLLACLPQNFHYRTLRAEDLQRLELYVPKIQNLFLESNTVIILPLPFRPMRKADKRKNGPTKTWEELWEEISALQPISDLLSNLRRLRINNVIERLLVPLIGISGTNLTQLHILSIQNKQNQGVTLRFLDGIRYTPKLESLLVRDNEADVVDLIRESPLKYLRLDSQYRGQKPQYNTSPLSHEILQKSTLTHLTVSLTREWYSSKITTLHSRYLPALEKLWLNLSGFDPKQCEPSCRNIAVDSWTCRRDGPLHNLNLTNCQRRSPVVLLKGLDNPELSLLSVKFPNEVTGRKFLDVISAVNNSCRLGNLTELVLASGGWVPRGWYRRPSPKIQPTDLRAGLNMLLPLPRLKVLRLSVAPNFLDVLDLNLYRSMASGLLALEKLTLGHAEFYRDLGYGEEDVYERVPLHHLAAFCSMLPKIKEVSIGTLDGLTLEKRPRKKWACVGVESLSISHHVDVQQGEMLRWLILGLETYFPNSGQAKHSIYRKEYMFKKAN